MRIWCQVLRVLRSICCLGLVLLSKMKNIKNLSYVLHSSGLNFIVHGLLYFYVYIFILYIFKYYLVSELLMVVQFWHVTVLLPKLLSMYFPTLPEQFWQTLLNERTPLGHVMGFPTAGRRIRPLGQLIFAKATIRAMGQRPQKFLSHGAQ